jgi:hypothetical protein
MAHVLLRWNLKRRGLSRVRTRREQDSHQRQLSVVEFMKRWCEPWGVARVKNEAAAFDTFVFEMIQKGGDGKGE